MTANFIHSLQKIGAIKLGEFTLKSGKISPIYIDLRLIISYPDILRTATELMWNKIQSSQFDLICGIPYTALPIATCMSLQHDIPMVMRRKEKKSYGTKKLVEGAFLPGQRCLLVEDSVLETAEDIEAEGLKISDVVVLIDREQGGKQNLENKNYKVHAALTLSEILKALLQTNTLSDNEKTEINKLLLELS